MTISANFSPGRSMTLFAAAALLAASPAIRAGTPINERAAADPAGSVEVSNVAGTVRVTGWDRNEVEVTGELGDGAEKLEFAVADKVTRIKVILPRKGVLEMTRFLDDSDEAVEIQIGANHLRANLKGLTFTSKLIDGRFPDYNKVIPSNQTKQILLKRDSFRETLNRAAILSNEKYRGVRFGLNAGVMTITAHNPEQEEAQEEMAVEYKGEELEIGFNVNYISEAVGALDGDEVEFGLSDPNSSCLLRTPGNAKHLYVVMPMRL